MTATALVLALLAAPVGPADGAKAMERLKTLEGNWRSKSGPSLAVRQLKGAVVETVHAREDQALLSLLVYRLEGAELVAMYDGEGHLPLRLVDVTATTLTLEGKDATRSLVVTITTKDQDSLSRSAVLKAGGAEKTEKSDFTREYLDRLK